MASKYIDIPSVTNVIGNVFSNPKLLGQPDKYFFAEDDFIDDFHKIVFGAIFNLYQLGAKEITLNAIEDYLSTRPRKKATYDINKGNEYYLTTLLAPVSSLYQIYYQDHKAKINPFLLYLDMP